MKLIRAVLLLVLGAASAACAQSSRAGKWPDAIDLAYGFTTIQANAGPGKCGCYLMQGEDAQFEFNRRSGIGALFDYGSTSVTNLNNSEHNIALSTYMSGVRYSRPLPKRFSPYAQALFGVAHTSTNFLLDNGSTGLAYAGGGGVDLALTQRIDIRLVQVDDLITHVPNGADNRQNQLRFTIGLVYHLVRPGF